jgi:glycosyltransferase involved in cell wall biosynthesis
MACGTTPIVTDIPASRVIVGDAGPLTKVGDALAMAEAIIAWSARDRVTLRKTTRARFDTALTFDVIGAQLRSAYESLLGMSAGVRGGDATLKQATRAPMLEEWR